MSTTSENSALLTGRLVFVIGDLFAGETAKIYGTQQPKLNKQGQQYKEYGFGLAVPKSWFADQNYDAGNFWNKIHMFVASQCGGQIPANFKMKFIDGDTGKSQDGTPVNGKEGYPGHIVFTFKTTIPPKFFRSDRQNIGGQEQTVYTLINEGIENGYWVRVHASFDINKGANPSVYINPQAVELVGIDKEIVNAPSGAQIFGAARPVALPPGVAAPGAAPQGNFAPPPQAVPPAAFTPPQGQAQAPAPQAAPPPNWGVLPPVHQPPPGQGYAAPAANPAYPPAGTPPGPTAPNAYPGSPSMPPLPGFNR